MAGPYDPPVKNQGFQVRVALQDFANPGTFKVTPTIAAGDFQVDIDGAGFGNLGTIPSVSPAATCAVLVTLSATEMNGDLITIRAVDQTNPKEWADLVLCIQTVEGTAQGIQSVNTKTLTADAITASVIADGSIDAATFAAGAITSTVIAADAITDANVAADVTIGSVTGAVGSVTGNVGGNVTGSIGSLATQAKADVNAEVVDAVATDTYAEPGQGAPAAIASLATKVNYLYKLFRNKIRKTSTAIELYADDGTTIDQKATITTAGTTETRGEIISGP